MEEKSPDNDATLDQQPKCVSKKFVYIPSESAIERAVKIIEEKKIFLVPEARAWMVEGSSGDRYTVSLFENGVRRPKCTCASPTTCAHLMAAMRSIDCYITSGKRGNTATLRRRALKRPYKRSGKKKPCVLDKESHEKKAYGIKSNVHLFLWPKKLQIIHVFLLID